MSIYADMTELAKDNDEALPNYQVSGRGWLARNPSTQVCLPSRLPCTTALLTGQARAGTPRHVRDAFRCGLPRARAPQVGQQEVNGMIQGNVEPIWHRTLDENPDRCARLAVAPP